MGSSAQLLLWLTAITVVVCGIYLFQGGGGDYHFIRTFRLPVFTGLVLTAAAIGLSTLLFQTLSGNRILTPSLMGFDALYMLLQTSIIFFFGSLAYLSLPAHWKFFGELTLMALLSVTLFSTLLTRLQSDFSRLILTGIILGVLFRSLSGFMGRVMDPTEFAIVQSASYARFNQVDEAFLCYATGIVLLATGLVYLLNRRLDVMALGRDTAIGLGVNYDKSAFQVMALVAVLVATATALVGPVVFLGLLISSLVYQLSPDYRHAVLIPLTILVGILVVIGGQLILERLLQMQVTISIVIELLGGVVFLYLILVQKRRHKRGRR